MSTSEGSTILNSGTVNPACVVGKAYRSCKVEPKKSEDYYLDPVTFQVDDTLFKVPQYLLVEESSIFRDMYALPQCGGDASAEGASDENPIFLEGIDAGDFANLLKELYPRARSPRRTQTLAEQTGALKLATMWGFSRIRKATISRMESEVRKLSSVDKILLAHERAVDDWFLDGLVDLVSARRVIAKEEWEKLGWEWAFRLFTERERCFLKNIGTVEHTLHCPQCRHTCINRWKGGPDDIMPYPTRCQHDHSSCCSCGRHRWTIIDPTVSCSDEVTHRENIKQLFQEELKDIACRGLCEEP